MTITSGRGRPSKYSQATIGRVTHYTRECVDNGKLPTIEGLATYLSVGTRTIYDWEAEYPDFSQTIDILKDEQRRLLITNALDGSYNARFAMFLLKANHGMTEKEPLVEATQNNSYNISPDLVAEALRLMKQKEGS